MICEPKASAVKSDNKRPATSNPLHAGKHCVELRTMVSPQVIPQRNRNPSAIHRLLSYFTFAALLACFSFSSAHGRTARSHQRARPHLVLQDGFGYTPFLAWSHDSRWLVVANSFGEFSILNRAGEVMATEHLKSNIATLAWSLNDSKLAIWTGTSVQFYDRSRWALSAPSFTRRSPNQACLCWLAGGKTVVIRNADDAIETLNAVTRSTRVVWKPRANWPTYLTTSPDGRLLTISTESGIKILNTDGKILQTLKPPGGLTKAEWQPGSSMIWTQNSRLYAASYYGTMVVWDAKTGRVVRIIRGAPGFIASLSNDLTSISGIDVDCVPRCQDPALWYRHGNQIQRVNTTPNRNGWNSFALSPDHRTFVVAYRNDDLVWYDARSGRTRRVHHGWDQWADTVSFSPDSRSIAIGYGRYAGRLQYSDAALLDLDDGHLQETYPMLYTINRHELCKNSLAFSRDGEWLVTKERDADRSYRIRIHHPRTREIIREIRFAKAETPTIIRLSPDGKMLACGMADGRIKVWLHFKQVLAGAVQPDLILKRDRVAEPNDYVNCSIWLLTFSPSGHLLLANSYDSTSVWNLPQGKKVTSPNLGDGWYAFFSPDGTRFWTANGGDEGKLVIYRWNTKTLRKTQERALLDYLWEFPQRSSDLAPLVLRCISPDGTKLVTTFRNSFRLWNADNWRALGRYEGPSPLARLHDIAWSTEGATVACADGSANVRLWNMHSGTVRADIKRFLVEKPNHTFQSFFVIHTPDDAAIVSPGGERFLRWRVGDRLLPAGAFPLHPERVRAALNWSRHESRLRPSVAGAGGAISKPAPDDAEPQKHPK